MAQFSGKLAGQVGEFIGAFIIFLTGFTFNYVVEYIRRKRELRRIKEDFIFEVNSICDGMSNQSIWIEDLSEQFNNTE